MKRALWLAIGLAACAPADRSPATDRPVLTLVDSITLQEADSTWLADLGPYFTVDADGDLYIPEQQSSSLLRFHPSGELAMVFGRRGRGPGEFGYVGPIVLVVDSLVLVEANFTGQIQAFHRTSGEYLGSIPFAGVNITAAVATASHFIWGNLHRSANRGVMLAPRSSVLGGPRDDRARLGSTLHPLPAVFDQYPELDRFYVVPLAAWGDTLVVSFAVVDWLVRSTLDGTPIDTVTIPARRRRGVSPATLEVFGAVPFDFEQAYQAISVTFAIWRLPDGSFVIWHQDGTVRIPDPSRPQIEGRAFVSIVRHDLSAACVDAEVPAPGSGRSRLAMRADTLYALDQVIDTSARTGLRTVVRRYLLSADGCAWQATAPGNH